MTQFTYSEELFSDYHKDAYGFRPRGYHEFYDPDTTPERKQEIWDQTGQAFAEELEREAECQRVAQIEFEELVHNTIEAGAPDRATAIRWIIDAETESEIDLRYGASYFEWSFGLKYGSYTEEFTPIIKEIEKEYEHAR